MEVTFTVFGRPIGKGRPRFARRGNFVSTYTPEKTVNYETQVGLAYKAETELFFGATIPLVMMITAYLPIPKSVSKKHRQLMLEGKMRPLKKPDSTNIAKSIEDGLNGIAYHDDTQIVLTLINRLYSDEPRVVVTIITLNEEGEIEWNLNSNTEHRIGKFIIG